MHAVPYNDPKLFRTYHDTHLNMRIGSPAKNCQYSLAINPELEAVEDTAHCFGHY